MHKCALSLSVLCAAVCLNAHANTAAPTATGFGVDDHNVSTLVPYPATFVSGGAIASTALEAALATSAFNGSTWNFNFADPTTIPASSLTVNTYTAWVVTNDPTDDPGGTSQTQEVMGQDAGGANFAMTYTPRANSTDPAAGSIHFLQLYRESINGGADTYAIDNAGADVPWYDELGISDIGAASSWLFDIPYTCEAGLTSNDDCTGGVDEAQTSANVEFWSYVAVDTMNAGVNDVVLYGGENWGYDYTAVDNFVAEPTSLVMLATGGLLLGTIRRRKITVSA